LQKLEEVRFREKLASEEKGKESFRVMQYARASQIPVAPEKQKLALLIILAAFGSGIGIIALLHYFDDSVNTVEEAKEFVGIPMLGIVPSLRPESSNGHHSFFSRLIEAGRRRLPDDE
jgi:capsular polysaccharide biosynthesis protein